MDLARLLFGITKELKLSSSIDFAFTFVYNSDSTRVLLSNHTHLPGRLVQQIAGE